MITLAFLGIALSMAVLVSTAARDLLGEDPDVFGDGWALVSNPD